MAVSLVGHTLVLMALLSTVRDAPQLQEPRSILVALTQPPEPPKPPPPPEEPSTPPGPAKTDTASASTKSVQADRPRPTPRSILRPTPTPPPDVEPLPASPKPARAPTITVGEGLLASAGTAEGPGGAGNGGGGGGCNMVKLLQNALRKNAKVRTAISQAHPEAVSAGKAIMVWDGDWVRAGAQDGKGLAGLRQAIALEVAFAPEACRADPVRGLVLIKLNDGPGSVRIVLGSNRWRWLDLLFAN